MNVHKGMDSLHSTTFSWFKSKCIEAILQLRVVSLPNYVSRKTTIQWMHVFLPACGVSSANAHVTTHVNVGDEVATRVWPLTTTGASIASSRAEESAMCRPWQLDEPIGVGENRHAVFVEGGFSLVHQTGPCNRRDNGDPRSRALAWKGVTAR